MKKLKTLKDIFIIGHSMIEAKEAVKEEAIKWVKDCSCERIKIKIQDNDEPEREEIHRDYCFACIRFKLFFNIIEDDLK